MESRIKNIHRIRNGHKSSTFTQSNEEVNRKHWYNLIRQTQDTEE